MPIELIPPQREGLHIGILPIDRHWVRVMARLPMVHRLDTLTTLKAVRDTQEARDRCDLVFELHEAHWRLVDPISAPERPGIWHRPKRAVPALASALGAARWLSEMLQRPARSSLEFPDLMLWLRDGGQLMWRRIAGDPGIADDLVLEHVDCLVNEHTRHQLLDLEMPSLPGARMRLMGLKETLRDLAPGPAHTMTFTRWERIDPDNWPQVRGIYMVLQGAPCPSESPFQRLELELPA